MKWLSNLFGNKGKAQPTPQESNNTKTASAPKNDGSVYGLIKRVYQLETGGFNVNLDIDGYDYAFTGQTVPMSGINPEMREEFLEDFKNPADLDLKKDDVIKFVVHHFDAMSAIAIKEKCDPDIDRTNNIRVSRATPNDNALGSNDWHNE